MCQNNGCSCADKKREDLLNLIEKYKEIPGSLIAVLHQAQEMYGYLPKEVLYEISKGLKVPIGEVMGIVTFYSFFSTVPKGKYNVVVCMGTACYVRGADHVLETFKKDLNIALEGTTDDKLFSLEQSRCFGACGLAPVIGVNGIIHKQVTAEDVPTIIKHYKEKEDGGNK